MTLETPNYGNRPLDDEGIFRKMGRVFVRDAEGAPSLSVLVTSPEPLSIGGNLRSARLFQLLYYVLLLGSLAIGLLCAPVLSSAALAFTAFTAVPLAIVAWLFTSGYARTAKRILTSVRSHKKPNISCWGVTLFLSSIATIWAANIILDHTQPAFLSSTIEGKHVKRGLFGSTSYDVSTLVVVPPHLGFDAPSEVSTSLNADEYAAAVVGRSQVTLYMHPGYFELPWYEKTHELQTTDTTVGSSAPRAPTAHPERNPRPDSKRAVDPLSKRAENLSSEMLRAYMNSPLEEYKDILNHADLELSHIRWEYVYNGMSAHVYEELLDQLNQLVSSDPLQSEAERRWERQTAAAIAQNRNSREGRSGTATPN